MERGTKLGNQHNNRDKYAILATILKSCMDGGVGSTQIMYVVMLSNDQCKKFIAELLNTQLLRFRDDVGTRVKYETTLKGVDFIDTYTQLVELAPDIKV